MALGHRGVRVGFGARLRLLEVRPGRLVDLVEVLESARASRYGKEREVTGRKKGVVWMTAIHTLSRKVRAVG